VPIAIAPETRRDISELKADVILLPNELLYGITAIPIPGATPGETAFFAPSGVMVIGDAVINTSLETVSNFCRINIAPMPRKTVCLCESCSSLILKP